ncbi:hypothetical protein JOF56_004367 [Kibdelosporangium banguiense]|uniref:ATPase AAA-type core domain-containing protein n=1 Tax=Kibdelosporangium banguiense TaxID=1365924 RepID=A0ABS4THS1_9PSEU|nr:ATP-binding protein [Kibdelosporangium banguiense]MBP2323982.1 hypothetical protein [Kibdelosporangium banguiense]
MVPVAAIYGANASGKSNLLDGLEFMASAVRDSFASWPPDGGMPRRPFRLDPAAREKPSTFVVELVISDVRYTYGFVVDDHKVREEWLYSYPEKRKRVLFERERNEVKFGSTVAELRVKLEVLADLLRSNALFLSLAAQSNVETLLPVYRWFTRTVSFLNSQSLGSSHVATFVKTNQSGLAQMRELLRVADLGISDVIVEDHPEGDWKIAFSPDGVVRLLHGDSGEKFDLEEESAGTRSWLAMLPIVLTTLADGGTLVVDEIDTSLHPVLVLRLVKLFHDRQTNPAGAQLIFTTHDATLLHPPLAEEALARDEIWFIEKEPTGASSLYPLTDFKPRAEDNLERRYLAGKYGAVPNSLEEDFISAIRSVPDDKI